MDIMTYILIAIVICVVIFAKMALVIIPQSETKIVERLGRYYATLQPGINIIIPFIDRAKSIVVLNHGRYMYSTTIDLREQVYDFPSQNVITKDNIQMEINALLYFQIVDPSRLSTRLTTCPTPSRSSRRRLCVISSVSWNLTRLLPRAILLIKSLAQFSTMPPISGA